MLKLRFAPSPTGFLHVGNARVALINWLYAHQNGGEFILRFDDTDPERSRPDYVEGIKRDLSWLGLGWSRLFHQSQRLDLYRAAFERLAKIDRIYPCYETPEELALMRKRLLAQGKPPIYDRSALDLSASEQAQLTAQGRRPHWRFRLKDEPVSWEDRIHGTIRFAKPSISDPVLYRSDGQPLFTLPSVVDDIDLSISLIVRGDDHIANTAAQIDIFRALGANPPHFAHLPLLRDHQGGDLSKRQGGALSLGALREKGIEAMALNSYLAGLGASRPVDPVPDLERLSAGFDFALFSRAGVKFDDRNLMRCNERILHDMPFAGAGPRLAQLGLGAADESFWLAVRGNLERLEDAAFWWRVCHGALTPHVEDKAYLATALAVLPSPPWDHKTWSAWTTAIKRRTQRTGKALFRPLRLALTGVGHGPGLDLLLPLMDPARVTARLGGKTQ